jgi:hypothetical protein
MSALLAAIGGADAFGVVASVLAIAYLLYALVRGERL